MNSIFQKLVRRSGNYSNHYLIKLHDDNNNIVMYYTNNNEDIVYEGVTYKAGTFKYKPSVSDSGFDGGGSLEISVKDNSVIDLVETYNSIHLEIVAGIHTDGSIQKITSYKHHYGSINGNRKTVSFTFDKDDRQDMTFPTLIWSNQNNRGNS